MTPEDVQLPPAVAAVARDQGQPQQPRRRRPAAAAQAPHQGSVADQLAAARAARPGQEI